MQKKTLKQVNKRATKAGPRAETVDTRIGRLDFELGVPTKETVAKLFDEMDFQRACQLYLWALPAVNSTQAKLYAEVVCGSKGGDCAVFEGYHNLSGCLTPNVITPYISGDLDLAKSGPMVVEVPAGLLAGSAIKAKKAMKIECRGITRHSIILKEGIL